MPIIPITEQMRKQRDHEFKENFISSSSKNELLEKIGNDYLIDSHFQSDKSFARSTLNLYNQVESQFKTDITKLEPNDKIKYHWYTNHVRSELFNMSEKYINDSIEHNIRVDKNSKNIKEIFYTRQNWIVSLCGIISECDIKNIRSAYTEYNGEKDDYFNSKNKVLKLRNKLLKHNYDKYRKLESELDQERKNKIFLYLDCFFNLYRKIRDEIILLLRELKIFILM